MAQPLKLVPNTGIASREQMLEALEQSAPVQAALAERQRLVAARRRQLVTELTKLEQAAATEYEARTKEIDAAVALVRKLERELADARSRQWTASQVRMTSSAARGTRMVELEAELVESCHPGIDVFIRWCQDEHQRVRHMPGLRVIEGISENALTGQKVIKETNNRAAILKRMDALREAQHVAEDLRLVADQSGVEAALEKLKASIPSIGV